MGASDADAISAFKQQLGIHVSEESAFGWIAEVGLQSPLPPRWTSHTDVDSGFVYYVDHDRQSSSWENPLVPFLRRVVEIGRNYQQKQPGPGWFEEQKGALWHQHKHELDCWHGPFADETGKQYFVNSTEGVSSWSDPRIDAQYIFELESGLLTSLEEVLSHAAPDTPGFGQGRLGLSLDGARYCKTAEGADVLTLDGTSTSASSRPATGRLERKVELFTKAQHNAKEEHKSVLQRMTTTAVRMHDMHQDDLEAQRLQVSQKVEARRQRARTPQGLAPAMTAASADPGVAPAPVTRIPRRLSLDESTCPGGAPTQSETGVPPPPPPPALEPGAVAVPPPEHALRTEGAGLQLLETDIFKPPSLPPSPSHCQRPSLPAELEIRMKHTASEAEAFQAADFGRMELRSANEA